MILRGDDIVLRDETTRENKAAYVLAPNAETS